MSWSAKCTWKPETPGQRAGGSANLRGEVGKRREVVPEDRGLAREAIARELHPVAGVAGEPDHDPLEVLDGLAQSHARGIADEAATPHRPGREKARPGQRDGPFSPRMEELA